jgi:hypothetical protein
VTDVERLRRAYRRLMCVYPRWYRVERGTELVTTLLDDAMPGQRRPTRAEVIDLVRGGLRTRLRLPGGAGPRVVAALIALYVAVVGAGVGALLTGFPGAPSEDQGIAVAMAAVPQQPRNVPGAAIRCDIVCPEWDGRDDVVAIEGSFERDDRVVVYYDTSRDRVPGVVAQARDRLAARGWKVTPVEVADDSGFAFEAVDGRFRLRLAASSGADDTAATAGASVRIAVSKVFPASAVIAAMAVGFVVGMFAGRLLAAWALQRFHRHAFRRRLLTAAVAGPFLTITPFLLAGAGWLLLVFSFVDPSNIVKGPLLVVPGGWVPAVNYSDNPSLLSTAWTWSIVLVAAIPALSAAGALGTTGWPRRIASQQGV